MAPKDRVPDAEERVPRLASWRRWLGLALFVLHLVLPVLAAILVPILGLPAGTNAILLGASVVGGPDVLLFASIALLGKDGVAELMGKLGSVVHRLTRWDAVTKRRYTVGLWVLISSLLLPVIVLFFWHDSIEGISGQPGWGFWLLLTCTFATIGAVMCMGKPLWSRIQAIFSWEAVIVFPDDDS